MSSSSKGAKSLVEELFRAVIKLSSAASSGVKGTPINPGPTVDMRHGKGSINPRPRR